MTIRRLIAVVRFHSSPRPRAELTPARLTYISGGRKRSRRHKRAPAPLTRPDA